MQAKNLGSKNLTKLAIRLNDLPRLQILVQLHLEEHQVYPQPRAIVPCIVVQECAGAVGRTSIIAYKDNKFLTKSVYAHVIWLISRFPNVTGYDISFDGPNVWMYRMNTCLNTST